MKITLYLTLFLLGATAGLKAQDTTRKKTIEITSSFKPVLKPVSKMNFTASPAFADTSRPALVYNVPIQNLSFGFTPSPLKPLSYQDSVTAMENRSWVKLGYGNFATAYVNGVAGLGNGTTNNGSVSANFISQKGKLAYQQYSRYGVGANGIFTLNKGQQFSVNGDVNGFTTYKYGYRPETLNFISDSLKQVFTDIGVSLALSNSGNNEAGINYNASIGAGIFTDNHEGNELQLNFDLPFSKKFGDKLGLQLGISGMVDKFDKKTGSIVNNLFMVNTAFKYDLSERLNFKAGISPSWNNGVFKLLPDIQAEFLIDNQAFVIQAGFKGDYTPQTYRSLAKINPWISQPDQLINSRNTEFFGAIKAVVDEHISFRVKAGFVKMTDVPLFVNDKGDGKTFRTVFEPELNNLNIAGEMHWRFGEKFDWYNRLTINNYSNLTLYDKAYGLLPLTYNTTLRAQVAKGLMVKADLYNFAAAWNRSSAGIVNKGQSGIDLNAGLEFKIIRQVDLWMQFNNMLNRSYERWNQYQVLGFQALGGVIVHF